MLAIFRAIELRMNLRVWAVRLFREEVFTGFWWENLRDRDHIGDPQVYGKIILR